MTDEKGSALLTTLVLTVVLAMLGSVVAQYATMDARLVSSDEKRMQAFYLARSGADAVAHCVVKDRGLAEILVNSTSIASPATGSLGAGEFQVNVVDVSASGDLSEVRIDSTGLIGEARETVSLVLLLALTPGNVFDVAVFATGDMEIGGNSTVIGDVAANGSITVQPPASVTGNVTSGMQRTYPDFSLPPGVTIVPHEEYHYKVTGNKERVINGNYEFGSIEVHGSGKLIFDTDAVPPDEATGKKHMYVQVDDFVAASSAQIQVRGSGRLFLFVHTFGGGGRIANNTGNPDALVIFVEPGGAVDLKGTVDFCGGIYAPEAEVNLKGTVTVTGSVIANRFREWGNPIVTFHELDIDHLPLPSATFEDYAYVRLGWDKP